MKCPNCGAKMKDGHMYCEVCGNEIQIVPEFEPEIENSIRETLSDVANEIGDRQEDLSAVSESGNIDMEESEDTQEQNEQKKLNWRPLVLSVILFLAAVACLYGFWINQPNELYQKAMSHMEKEEYEAALAAFENAVTKAGNNIIYLNSMADCCLELGYEERAVEISKRILDIEKNDLASYMRLVRIYKNQEAYEEINTFLQDCESREIVNQFLDFMANPPSFDMESGTYREKITVKLIANAAGTLYYTLDGSIPTTESEVYTAPLSLESGDFVIRAVFVNQYGVMSEVSTANYHVDVSRPKAPDVAPESGEYNLPGYISVEVPENSTVYYASDGSVPDSTSMLYEGPFPMPAGNSSFQFVVCDEGGVCGEVTVRQYNLKLNAALSMEAAANQLLLTLKDAGVLQNLQGDVAGKNGRNIYTYKYALTIGEAHYYLYREYYEETSGNSNVTGNDYVVNYMTGECFKAVREETGEYELIPAGKVGKVDKTQESRT